ncbi:MAG TPA: ChrR family anti-sigma-E factor [Cellvibrionaceae bacterium]
MSKYHPDNIMLLDYAAGNLPPAQALAIAVHLFLCHHCRLQVAALNQLGGELLDSTAPQGDVGITDFDSLMAHIETAPVVSQPQPAARKPGNPLLRYLPASLDQLPWKKQSSEISKFDLTSALAITGFQVNLQKIKAGARVPHHTHKGEEITVILSGGFSDELGVYHAGDFVSRDGQHRHSPTALQNEDCICLTVLDAPIKFTGPLYRLLNPFMAW